MSKNKAKFVQPVVTYLKGDARKRFNEYVKDRDEKVAVIARELITEGLKKVSIPQ